MKKKIFSLVLCVMLLVGLIPVKVLAYDSENITEVSLTYSQPKIGASCITDLEIVSSDPADSCHILKAQWYDETAGAEVDSSDTFIAGHNYHLNVELYVDGDQNTFMLWIVLLLVAGGALAGLLVFRRRTE